MKRSRLFIGAAIAAVACASGAAHAARVGVFVGGGMPYYYPVAPMPYYYAPGPVVVAPAPPPPDYVERGDLQPAPPPAPGQYPPGAAQGPQTEPSQAAGGDTWYYCDASKAYYPYVKQCPSGWRAVPAQPTPDYDDSE